MSGHMPGRWFPSELWMHLHEYALETQRAMHNLGTPAQVDHAMRVAEFGYDYLAGRSVEIDPGVWVTRGPLSTFGSQANRLSTPEQVASWARTSPHHGGYRFDAPPLNLDNPVAVSHTHAFTADRPLIEVPVHPGAGGDDFPCCRHAAKDHP